MEYQELLTTIGLSENEAAIYLELLQNGPARISKLSRKTGLHRPGLYKELPEMVNRGLLGEIREGKSVLYEAVSPTHLERHYLKKQGLIQKGLSELEEEYNHNHEKPEIKFLEGRAGVNHVFKDVVATVPYKGTYFRYTSKTDASVRPEEYAAYAEIRDKKRLEQKIITSASKKLRKKDTLEKFYKAVPPAFDLFEDNLMFLIYGPKIAMVDYDSKAAFIIESEKIARFQEKIFKLLWKKL